MQRDFRVTLLGTGYHSDHTVDIPDLWLTGWLQSHFATRRAPFRVIGPVGANTLVSHLEEAYTLDINIRIEDEKLPPESAAIVVEEFDNDGIVYEKNGVRVIAFEVDHGDVIKPAYGYRIEYGGRAVVISGDTRHNDNVVKYGAGADLLIHEVAIVRPELASVPYIQRIMAHHTTAREAGAIFERAKPKLAFYAPLFLASEQIPPASVDELIEHPIAGDELRASKRYLATREDNLPWLFVSERQAQLTRQAVNYIVRCRREGETGPRLAAHAAPQLRLLLSRRPRHRSAHHAGLPRPPRSQAYRPLHPCCRVSV